MQTEGVDLDGLKAAVRIACDGGHPEFDVAINTLIENSPALIAEIERLRAAPAEAELPTGASILAAERATRQIGGMMAALAVGYFAMCCYARPIGDTQ